MFASYLDEFIDKLHAQSNPNGTLFSKFETIQFYLYWSGCYF